MGLSHSMGFWLSTASFSCSTLRTVTYGYASATSWARWLCLHCHQEAVVFSSSLSGSLFCLASVYSCVLSFEQEKDCRSQVTQWAAVGSTCVLEVCLPFHMLSRLTFVDIERRLLYITRLVVFSQFEWISFLIDCQNQHFLCFFKLLLLFFSVNYFVYARMPMMHIQREVQVQPESVLSPFLLCENLGSS